ncbi:MAG: hypothetical protein HY840_13040 [Bacteroidetes bacterium]|nr:hypothetical protein [Bacteroidota bacterium]
MRKQIPFLLLFIFANTILFAQKTASKNPTQTKEKTGLQVNNIKSQSAFEFTFKMGQKGSDSICLFIKKFNQKGIAIENLSPAERIIYTYNDQGKLVEESYYDSTEKNILYKDQYQYNENRTLSMKTEYGQKGQKIFSVSSIYNPQKQEIERAVIDSSGKLQSKLIFFYDVKKNIASENELNSFGKVITKKIFTYNPKNNLTSLTIVKNDTITSKYSHEYNAMEQKIKTVCYNSDGTINYKTVFNYNAKGMLSEETTYQGTGFSKMSYQYDSKGNMTQGLKTNDRNTILEKITYHYNSKGLLREEIQYNTFDEPQSVTKYYYEFYPEVK